MNTIILVIIGMGLVTYLPRMLPFVLLQNKTLPPFLEGVLKNVPYAILGALIFPKVFLIQKDPLFGTIGAGTAIILALTGANVIIVVLGAIAVLSFYSFMF